ncbi:hypothetical protein BU17DRAFT_94859 [Hysterangium stoloniferum]|nr:hypothetical protein BU17DRAFT_94859 [Hysterangium stoloniferum]
MHLNSMMRDFQDGRNYRDQRIKGEQMHDQALNYKSTQSSLSMQSFKALIILAIAFIATQGTVTAIADDESNPRKVMEPTNMDTTLSGTTSLYNIPQLPEDGSNWITYKERGKNGDTRTRFDALS